jgi:hypothetical protein
VANEPLDSKGAPVWHVISSDDLLAMLRRVAAGEDADLVYIEEYVNAEREDYRA